MLVMYHRGYHQLVIPITTGITKGANLALILALQNKKPAFFGG